MLCVALASLWLLWSPVPSKRTLVYTVHTLLVETAVGRARHWMRASSLPCGRCWSGNNHWTHARWLTPVASSVWKCCPRHFQGQALPSRLDKAATEARLVRARALVLALALVRSDVASPCTIAVPSLRQLRCNCWALAFVTTKQLFDSALYLRAPRSVCGYPLAFVVPQKPAYGLCTSKSVRVVASVTQSTTQELLIFILRCDRYSVHQRPTANASIHFTCCCSGSTRSPP